ncbi:MAG: hypothetical protein O3B01_02425 [Planctomycetota bacterium]|nr:hypothetical protein [Planctomycetota bacterium]
MRSLRNQNTRGGFTLLEIVVAGSIILLLMAIVVPFFIRTRHQSKIVQCVSNVRGLAGGLNLYREIQSGVLPPLAADLIQSLSEQIDNPAVFLCPDDATSETDSYSIYYVPRKREGADVYVLGCGRHFGGEKAVEMLLDGTVLSGYSGKAKTDADGTLKLVPPTTQVGSGILWMVDGTKVEIKNNIKVDFLQSFLEEKNSYHVIRIPLNSYGKLEVEIATGARLDVVTPSANIRAQGGVFTVDTGLSPIDGSNHNYTVVLVSAGKVEVTPLVGGRAMELTTGKKRTFIGTPVP